MLGRRRIDHLAQRKGRIAMKVLYVEDNDDDVYMLKTRLELAGDFEVLTARNGERAASSRSASGPTSSSWTWKCPLWTAGKPRGGSKARRKRATSLSSLCRRMRLRGSVQERLRRDVTSLTPSRFSSS